MRIPSAVALCLAGLLLGGCPEDARTVADKRLDTALVRTLNNVGIENAIITQHTLYPYEFVPGGETLNELGQRDFAVLARHFAEHPGILNIRQGQGVSPQLYQARVAHVTNRLKQAGITPERVSLTDGWPGGPGMCSEQVVTVLQEAAQTSQRTSYDGTVTTR